MRQLVSLLRRFRRDEGGAFAMIFAVAAIAIIAMSGAVVDFTGVQQARTRAQVALDAAALALQPTIYTASSQTIQTEAQNLLVASLADAATTWTSCLTNGYKAPCAYVGTPTIDTTAGQLTLDAQIEVPTNFVSLIGVSHIPSQIVSVATRQKLNLEVAMVLDNSGSMNYSIGYTYHVNNTLPTRMQTLQSAANCATNILFYGVTTCTASTTGLTAATNVKMGVVPFNDEVNVGTGNASATWLDRSGGSSSTFADDNFNTDSNFDSSGNETAYTGSMDRIALFSSIKDKNGHALSWGGCVEARYNDGISKFYDTDDTTPDTSDRQTLFTPLFAPDEPDTSGQGYKNNYISDTTPSACYAFGNCSIPYGATATYTATYQVYTAHGTAKVTKTSTGQLVSTTSVTQTSTTGPLSQTTATIGSYTAGTPTITTASNATRTVSGICTCTGNPTATTSAPAASGPATTNGNPTLIGVPTNATLPTNTVQNNTPKSGQTTTTTWSTATNQNETQPMQYPVAKATTCSNASYAPWSHAVQASGGLGERQLQERLCKYTGSQMTNPVSMGFGPNADCPASAIQPLTATPSTLITAINGMSPGGNTNIQEGTAWGFRVLSPTAPFTEGGAYDQATSKVLIVMTDGENTYSSASNMNGSDLYAAYAYPWNNTHNASLNRGRMGDLGWTDAQFETSINGRLSTTCTNAKNAGITIYTIGLDTKDTSDPTGNTTLLTDCATLPAYAYFPNTASDLTNAFVSIAQQLAALRLSR